MGSRVGVIFGGRSTEHEISIISAVQAMHSMPSEYEIVPIYLSKSGEFYTGKELKEIKNFVSINSLLKKVSNVVFVKNGNHVDLVLKKNGKKLTSKVIASIDVAFPIVHGTNVEDGTLQGFLHLFGIPFVGGDVLSSAVGMDKSVQKRVFEGEGIPTLPHMKFGDNEDIDSVIKRIEEKISYPVIVKPINLGSSVGISVAHDRNELNKSIESSFGFASKILVEKAVVNLREINCAVLGDYEEAIPSALEEVVAKKDILDFEQKYMSNSGSKTAGTMENLDRIIPAKIPEEMEKTIKEMAVKAFKALGLNGVTRIDFLIDKDDNSIYVNEVNTIPGSLAFYLWKEVGMSYSEQLRKMIELAIKRWRQDSRKQFEFNTDVIKMAAANGGMSGVKK
ncbi:MAG: D-alanine--D-alanine ligase [Lachnospiraceae bacterium]|nr:D-alanine--D-alanine ligase [Lachnospiraceae bacterium]